MKPTIVQKIKINESTLSVAQKYYAIISAINDLNLTERELQLMAFTAVRGNMSYANIREDFCQLYKSSNPTINNIISKLKKKNVLVKDGDKVKVNPVLALDFKKNILINVALMNIENEA
jgi:predicted transcriptional regulator